MITIITDAELATYLSTTVTARLTQIADRANTLVNEAWSDPVDPAPARVVQLALDVAARAWRNDPTKPALESLTRSVGDASKTERYLVDEASRGGVYLTDDELARLNPTPRSPVRSIRMRVPGYR